MTIEFAKTLENTIKLAQNQLGPDNNPYLDQIITLIKAKLGPANNFTACMHACMRTYLL